MCTSLFQLTHQLLHRPRFLPPPVCPTHTFVVQETSAAVKLQSTYRKHRTMCDLEDRGYSTAAMRNRARARAEGAQRSAAKPYLSDDAPSIMACCGVGLLFGEDAAGHTDQEALAEDRRKDFEQTKKLVKHLEELSICANKCHADGASVVAMEAELTGSGLCANLYRLLHMYGTAACSTCTAAA